ncbi:hypothetical protein DFP72DRAFT_973986 [Ephemerocybe angulata]|uniref:Uncharacterized protein n=1 Tax=Ephemerocybe angulata TaxID=980116 RepID=A0A8H6LYX5_9AGAR|nr:hypothetical protein DFP72DRAFT_973986 [Tulosesus angulatus]
MDALDSDDVQATPATVKSELEEPTGLGRFYFDAATLTVSEAKRFRDFAFPTAVATPGHNPQFKVDCLEEWVLEKAYRAFQAWDSRKVQEENEDIDPDTLGFAVLKEYREFYIAPEFIGHPYFELDNLSTWFKPEAFRAFESYSHLWKARTSSPARSRAASTSSYASSRMSIYTSASLPPSSPRSEGPTHAVTAMDTDVIEISSESEDEGPIIIPSEHPVAPKFRFAPRPVKQEMFEEDDIVEVVAPRQVAQSVAKPTKKRARNLSPEPSNTSTDDGKKRTKKPNTQTKLPGKKATASRSVIQTKLAAGWHKVTRILAVKNIKHITEVPDTWDIPEDEENDSTAYLVDYEDIDLGVGKDGNPLTIDGYIRQEDQDGRGGSVGSTNGDGLLYNLFPDDPDHSVQCRRCDLSCQGVKVCEHFDKSLFENCVRYKRDDGEVRDLWEKELEMNAIEASSVEAVIVRFYKRAQSEACKIDCDGKPRLVKLAKKSYDGKNYFVGCSKWKKSQQWKHRYLAIPANVDEEVFKAVWENDGVFPDGGRAKLREKCALTLNTRRLIKDCPYSHVVNGKIVRSPIVRLPCKSKLVVFIPLDPEIKRVIVVPQKAHNHPAHPRGGKPSTANKTLLGKVIDAVGPFGLSTRKLLNAPSTLALCDGKPLAVVAPAYGNVRAVRTAIKAKKKEAFPAGLDWNATVLEMEREKEKAPDEVYIHSAVLIGGERVVMTGLRALLERIHYTLSLSCDISFKRTAGEFNEWKVTGFDIIYEMRITYGTGYCNHATDETFRILWAQFFHMVETVTKRGFLKLHAFFPEDPDARLHAILLDAEIAQVNGLKMALSHYVATRVPASSTVDLPDEDIELVMLTVKFCYIHFVRNIEKIAGLERDQIARLKSFSGLSTDEDVQEWHEFCKRLSQNSKAMKGWYEHKIAHPYLLTCVNKHLSLMAGTSWDITPKDTNLVEGAHAGRNADTGTNLALLEGIFLARDADKRLAQELETRATELVAHRHVNGLQIREKKSKARKDRISKQARERQDHVDNYFDLQAQVTSLMTSKSNSAALTKQLNAELAKIKDQLKITRTPSLEVQKSTLQARLDGEVTKRRTWTADAKEIKLQMEALQQGPLKGVSKERFRSDSSDDRIEDTLVPDSETRERSPSVLPSESATGSDVVEQDDHIDSSPNATQGVQSNGAELDDDKLQPGLDAGFVYSDSTSAFASLDHEGAMDMSIDEAEISVPAVVSYADVFNGPWDLNLQLETASAARDLEEPPSMFSGSHEMGLEMGIADETTVRRYWSPSYQPLPHQPFEGFDFFFGQDEPLYDNTFNGELTES